MKLREAITVLNKFKYHGLNKWEFMYVNGVEVAAVVNPDAPSAFVFMLDSFTAVAVAEKLTREHRPYRDPMASLAILLFAFVVVAVLAAILGPIIAGQGFFAPISQTNVNRTKR